MNHVSIKTYAFKTQAPMSCVMTRNQYQISLGSALRNQYHFGWYMAQHWSILSQNILRLGKYEKLFSQAGLHKIKDVSWLNMNTTLNTVRNSSKRFWAHLSIYLSVYLFTYPSIYLSTYLSIYLSTYLPTYKSLYTYIYIYVCVCVYMCVYTWN